MENFLIKNRKAFMVLFGNLFFLCLVLIFLNQFTVLSINKFISIGWPIFLNITLPFVWFFFFIQKNKKYYKNKINKFFKYGFLLLLVPTLITALKPEFANNLFILKNIYPIFLKINPLQNILFLIFGFFCFYFNCHKTKIIKNNTNEKEETKRIRLIPAFITKEGWFYVIALIVIISIGAYLRLYNLGNFSIYHDETFYSSSVKTYTETGKTNLYNFATNEPSIKKYNGLITIFLGNFIKVFGYNEYNLRLPFAIIGTLSIFAVYIFSRKIIGSKIISLSASLFVCFSDTLIYLSRFIRQYSIFVFLSIVISFYLFFIIKRIKYTEKIPFIHLSLFFLLNIITFKEISPFMVGLSIPYCLIILFTIVNSVKNKKSFYALLLGFIFLLLVDFFDILHLINIKHVIRENLILGFNEQRFNDYLKWIFGSFKISLYSIIFIFFIGVISVIQKNKLNGIILTLLCFAPFLFLTINQFHSHDFRYTAFVLPFVFIILSVGLYNFYLFVINLIGNKLKMGNTLFLVIISFFVIYLSVPHFNLTPITTKAQGDWATTEGKRIDRRTVAPQYSKAYDYLNTNQKNGDVVIIGDGYNYLKSLPETDYYQIPTWEYSATLKNLKNDSEINFFEMLENNKDKNIYFIGAYMHMLNPEVTNYLLANCENKSKDLNIFQYNYNSFYKNRFYWPNIFVCDN